MKIRDDLYGLVVCGGQSTRMGSDKGFLVYHEKPQCYHLADLLLEDPNPLCFKALISCNDKQTALISKDYSVLTDLPEYQNSGPIASLLTAFATFSNVDFLVIGCDYPFMQHSDLLVFLESIQEDSLAAAFYNHNNKYEPLLAWYSKNTGRLLKTFYENGGKSLQHFLKENSARKHRPDNKEVMTSVDTPEAFISAKAILANQKTNR
ncbi:molybdenum cofactor guanylyltransferase [Dyadobacter sp. CY312]|uniref:molybdenum cofactor guanylyltransferase n=1 Tax=Dyadobacter sp. CY312 TaxID=2907303 RepID=UPI001F344F66|nr:molybdenum cofactor guanylyltransferase [Dyadobacter sp. CY312]MCE7039989.1 molybdenum cofactor guanylyltransferase [Dyadobacter sp. CY312]